MTRKRQLLSNSIRLRIRLRGKQQLALSGVPDLMELAADLEILKIVYLVSLIEVCRVHLGLVAPLAKSALLGV